MSVDEYWYGDPYLYFAFEEKHKMQMQFKEQDMWAMGIWGKQVLLSTPVVATLFENKNQLVAYPPCPKFKADIPKEIDKEQEELAKKFRSKAVILGFKQKD